ncbi:hypothetical protein INS49_007973 [Diaporthe citri]|uniref:uncharacterized protein n=1 Tax=Diaporthe citri TaxID=83186 RepID=UPI001C810A48|nr:uncharacterized protein INS49_007973 [Diaporthe citri]KAG6362878.1 hypothetical protein INS49_007973 [Diaporthe citri]
MAIDKELNVTDTYELGITDLHTDDTTWLRAMWPTDANGMVEMKTIFPGFYIERAIHIHVQVYTDWTLHDNGTVTSGNLISTGQVYFDEDVEQQIMALEPQDTEGGYNPVFSIVAADGEKVENGMVGYTTDNKVLASAMGFVSPHNTAPAPAMLSNSRENPRDAKIILMVSKICLHQLRAQN